MKLNFLNKAQAQMECEKSDGFSQMNRGMMMGIDPQKTTIHDSDYIAFLKSHCLDWPADYVKTINREFLELQQLLVKRKIVIGKVETLNLIRTTGRENLQQCHFIGGSAVLPEGLGSSSLKSLTQERNLPLIGKFLTDDQYTRILITALFHLWIEANLDKFQAMSMALGYETISLALPKDLKDRLRDNRLEHIFVKKEVVLKNKKMVSVVPIRFYNEHCVFDGKRHPVKEMIERSGSEYTSQVFLVVSQNSQGTYEPLTKEKGDFWFLTEMECLNDDLFRKTSAAVIQDHPTGMLCDLFIQYVLNPSKLSTFNLALFDNFFKSEYLSQNIQETDSVADEAKPLLNQYKQKVAYSSASTQTTTQSTTQSSHNLFKKRY